MSRLLLALWVLVGCHRAPEPGALVLLLSLDTTRADALSCFTSAWGADLDKVPIPQTPALCALADQGVRFDMALAHAPTTLNSHSSVMTGLDPHQHRVVRNGFPLPEDLPVLAEPFAAAGWDTLAVLGASVLAADMGLSRGFRVYDDDLSEQVRKRYEDRADRVVDRALAALDRRNARDVLLFVHFFDAHSPWDSAPARFRQGLAPGGGEPGSDWDGGSGTIDRLIQRARSGELTAADRVAARALYLSEVAWVDEQVGRLLSEVRRRGFHQDVLIVVFGDHGENLEEIPSRPYGHGGDVHLGAIRVPLIVAGTGRFATPPRVERSLARLQDVGATVLARVGLASGLGEGRDLLGTPLLPVYSFAEATKPTLTLGDATTWSNLPLERSVAHGEHLLSRALYRQQAPALFALAPDQPPVEDPARAAALVGALDAWDAAAPGGHTVTFSAETEAALRSLGYLDQ